MRGEEGLGVRHHYENSGGKVSRIICSFCDEECDEVDYIVVHSEERSICGKCCHNLEINEERDYSEEEESCEK